MKTKSVLQVFVEVIAAVAISTSLAFGQFDDASNWAAYDAGDHGVGDSPDGYWGLALSQA